MDSPSVSPVAKRLRLDMSVLPEKVQIHSVLSDEFIQAIPMTDVYISTIADTKSLSKVIAELSKNLPISGLQHLKRVRNNQIILCEKNDIVNLKDVLIASGISAELVDILTANLGEIKVPAGPTKLRWQYDAMNSLWPCKFHPNKYIESLFTNTNFTDNERIFHSEIIKALDNLSHVEGADFGICVDPRFNSIVAVGPDRTHQNPIQHSPMVLIDFVARSQNSGAWDFGDEEFSEDQHDKCHRGVPKKFNVLIQNTFSGEIQFGAEISVKKPPTEDCPQTDNLNKYGPYLCTGYDVYLTKEPCLMCAMALVHSRAKRIFYIHKSPKGALGTKIKLHTVKDLNHHFEVFQCSLETR